MNNNLTHVSVILDRSGSMQNVRQATINGFNEFLQEQQILSGECLFRLVQFNSNISSGVDLPAMLVSELSPETYVPTGNTSLYDAIGTTINSLGRQFAAMPETDRPGKVVVVIQTDGQDTSSNQFTREQVFAMIKHQQEVYSWQFVFLGANQDAIAAGGRLGIGSGHSLSYAASNAGTMNTFRSASRSVGTYRSAVIGTALDSFTSTDRMGSVAVDPTPVSKENK